MTEISKVGKREVQARFAELLGHASSEVNVHVLLSMRDDFFVHCRLHPSLAPIFKDVTAMMPPVGPALRQALVAPAERSDYHFSRCLKIGIRRKKSYAHSSTHAF